MILETTHDHAYSGPGGHAGGRESGLSAVSAKIVFG
jgi:hypothetical protein